MNNIKVIVDNYTRNCARKLNKQNSIRSRWKIGIKNDFEIVDCIIAINGKTFAPKKKKQTNVTYTIKSLQYKRKK